ncbi:hypothetical protein Agub_g50, partial [Astrephomene gubernaculifera]
LMLSPSEESPLERPPCGGCWEFHDVSSAVRACEDAYLALAVAAGLLAGGGERPASLQQLLTRHLREVCPAPPGPSELAALRAALEGGLARRQLAAGEVLYGAGAEVREVVLVESGALVEEEHYEGGVRVGSREHGSGVVVGAVEFFLARPAPAAVRCASASCTLLALGRAAYGNLMERHPRALAALQGMMLRSACSDLAMAQEAAHHGMAV